MDQRNYALEEFGDKKKGDVGVHMFVWGGEQKSKVS
jgi:hypothetical protein